MGIQSTANRDYINKPPTTIVRLGQHTTLSLPIGDETVTASGALTANTYPGTPQINITGAGAFEFLAINSTDATARNITVKVVIDGVTVIEKTCTTSTTTRGLMFIGLDQNASFGALAFIPFNFSFQVYVKSTLTETDKQNIYSIHRTF